MLALNCFVHQLPGFFCRYSFLVFLAALRPVVSSEGRFSEVSDWFGVSFLPLKYTLKGHRSPNSFGMLHDWRIEHFFPPFLSRRGSIGTWHCTSTSSEPIHFKVSLKPKRKSRSPTPVRLIRNFHDQGNKTVLI